MVKTRRCGFWMGTGIAVVALSGTCHSWAQSYPVKPIRLLVGPSIGSQADFAARTVAQALPAVLGQPVVVENRPGASGVIAGDIAAKSAPDGYTLVLISSANSVLPALRKNLPYDLKRDFAPVSLLVVGPQVLTIRATLPAQNIKELIAYARSQPGKLSYGTTGIGTLTHLSGELFKFRAKIDLVHVPFKGGAESGTANAAGEIDMSFPSIPAAVSLINAGKLRALAISGSRRTAALPSVPTWQEQGFEGYDREAWYGIGAPTGVPRSIVMRLNGAIAKVLSGAELKEILSKGGTEAQGTTPEQFAAFISKELSVNGDLIRMAGVKAE